MATAKKATQPVKAQPGDLPKVIRLPSMFSFYDEEGTHRVWGPGADISDPDDVAELVGRGVEHEVVG
jgi:hypothetical protein